MVVWYHVHIPLRVYYLLWTLRRGRVSWLGKVQSQPTNYAKVLEGMNLNVMADLHNNNYTDV